MVVGVQEVGVTDFWEESPPPFPATISELTGTPAAAQTVKDYVPGGAKVDLEPPRVRPAKSIMPPLESEPEPLVATSATGWPDPGTTMFREVRPVPVDRTRASRAFITDRVESILRPLVSICLTQANQGRIRIHSIEIDVFHDPEEDWDEITFTIHVEALPPQALAYWDSIGRAMDRWKLFLPDYLTQIIEERIGVHVDWT